MLIERVTTIDAAPTTIWQLLTEPDRMREWMPEMLGTETDPPGQDPGVGVISKMQIKEGSKVVEYQTKITTWEPTNRVAIEMRGSSLGPNPMKVAYQLDAAGSTTTVSYRSEWHPGTFLLRLLTPLITWAGGRNATQAMERLADVASRSDP